ncbi:MAG TPA: M20/M25/M40 family metallo-hydrolase [Planctomycetota bacterium]|nr:M20/M25/M40 family metallo-hydrolase [Planctomycetota bacterium]
MKLRDCLRELVSIRSVSGSEAAVAGFCADRLRAAGLDVERVGDNVLARIARGRGPRVLFNTHLDTVPAGDGWTRDPFEARWDGDRLYGRGANDAKASVAAMIDAFSRLASERFAGELWLALTACEETTNAGMAAVLERVERPDAAVTGEPTGLRVVRAQSGLAVLIAEWSGRSCHAAHVARVDHRNALLAASAELAALAPYVALPEAHPLLGPSTIVPTKLTSGERHNVVPDRAECVFDARLAPPYAPSDAAAALAEKLPSAKVTVKSGRLLPVETPESHPLVRAALRCAGRGSAVGSSTMSDMALLRGVPAVKCGPGETERSHVPDEYVLESELEAGAAFYRELAPAALEAMAAAVAR